MRVIQYLAGLVAALSGCGIYAGGAVIHLIATGIAYSQWGIVAAIITLFTPVVGELFWVGVLTSKLGLLNNFNLLCFSYIGMCLFSSVCLKLSEKAGEKADYSDWKTKRGDYAEDRVIPVQGYSTRKCDSCAALLSPAMEDCPRCGRSRWEMDIEGIPE